MNDSEDEIVDVVNTDDGEELNVVSSFDDDDPHSKEEEEEEEAVFDTSAATGSPTSSSGSSSPPSSPLMERGAPRESSPSGPSRPSPRTYKNVPNILSRSNGKRRHDGSRKRKEDPVVAERILGPFLEILKNAQSEMQTENERKAKYFARRRAAEVRLKVIQSEMRSDPMDLTAALRQITQVQMPAQYGQGRQCFVISDKLRVMIKEFKDSVEKPVIPTMPKRLKPHHIDMLVQIEKQCGSECAGIREKHCILKHLSDFCGVHPMALTNRIARRKQELREEAFYLQQVVASSEPPHKVKPPSEKEKGHEEAPVDPKKKLDDAPKTPLDKKMAIVVPRPKYYIYNPHNKLAAVAHLPIAKPGFNARYKLLPPQAPGERPRIVVEAIPVKDVKKEEKPEKENDEAVVVVSENEKKVKKEPKEEDATPSPSVASDATTSTATSPSSTGTLPPSVPATLSSIPATPALHPIPRFITAARRPVPLSTVPRIAPKPPFPLLKGTKIIRRAVPVPPTRAQTVVPSTDSSSSSTDTVNANIKPVVSVHPVHPAKVDHMTPIQRRAVLAIKKRVDELRVERTKVLTHHGRVMDKMNQIEQTAIPTFLMRMTTWDRNAAIEAHQNRIKQYGDLKLQRQNLVEKITKINDEISNLLMASYSSN